MDLRTADCNGIVDAVADVEEVGKTDQDLRTDGSDGLADAVAFDEETGRINNALRTAVSEGFVDAAVDAEKVGNTVQDLRTAESDERVDATTAPIGVGFSFADELVDAKPCMKIEGKEGWTRIVFCLDPVALPFEGAPEAALQLQKGVRKHGPAPRGPLEREASRLLTQMRGK